MHDHLTAALVDQRRAALRADADRYRLARAAHPAGIRVRNPFRRRRDTLAG